MYRWVIIASEDQTLGQLEVVSNNRASNIFCIIEKWFADKVVCLQMKNSCADFANTRWL